MATRPNPEDMSLEELEAYVEERKKQKEKQSQQQQTGSSGAGGLVGNVASKIWGSSGSGTAGAGSQPVATGINGGTILANGTTVGGAGQGMTGMSGLGAGGTALGTAGIAAGAATGYQQGTGVKDFVEGKPLSTTQKAALALPTFGLSLVSDDIQGALGLDRKTTKEYQKERWGKLAEGIDPESETGKYIQGYGDVIAGGTPENSPQPKAFADMNALDKTPGLGFFQTFGNRWLEGFTEPQRIEIARRADEAGFIYSEKGDVLLRDPEAVAAIGEEVSQLTDLPTRYDLYPEEYGEAPLPTQDPMIEQGGSRVQPEQGSPGRRPPKPQTPRVLPPMPMTPPANLSGPPQPAIKTPQDYANAYMKMYDDNSTITYNPLNRSY